MVSPEKIKEVLIAGINRFVKPYSEPAENIQLVFRLKSDGDVGYYTFINYKIKETVKLHHIRGKDITNFVVNDHIKKLLKRFAADNNTDENQVNLMAGLRGSDGLFIWLRKGDETIREIKNAAELK